MCSKKVVYIAFADALSAPEVCWSLSDAGFKVIAFAKVGKGCALRYSRHAEVIDVPDPALDFAGCLASIAAAIARANRGQDQVIVMPLDDAALRVCCDLSLPPEVVLVGPDKERSAIALDKTLQCEIAHRAGFAVIPTVSFDGALPAGISGPQVIKPRYAITLSNGRLKKGEFKVARSTDHLPSVNSAGSDDTEYVAQPLLRGTGEGLFGLVKDGEVVAWSAHRRLRMMNPSGSGSSACVAVDPDPEAITCASKFVALTDWKGLFMLEFLRDEAGKLWFMEFNGRPWGSMALARRYQLEYPAWAVKCAIGEEVSLDGFTSRQGDYTCRHLGREILHLLFVFRGARSSDIENWPKLSEACRAVLKIGREDRWYNWRTDDKRVFLGDLWETLRGQVRRS